MADDVKVKFGGDFSEVPKGAEAAAKTAGTAMKDWFKDVGKSIVAPIAGFFAVDAVLGQIKDFISGMREQLTLIREMNHAIKKSGVDPKEFQTLAYAAKEAGVSMEDLGRALNNINVYIAKAQAGSESHRKALKSLFNTTEELNYSNLKASDVFYRLTDAYQDASQEAEVLALTSEIAGKKAGLTLIPMYEKTSEAIKKQAQETRILTDAERAAAEALDKYLKKLERKKALMEKEAAVSTAMQSAKGDIMEAERLAYTSTRIDPTGIGTRLPKTKEEKEKQNDMYSRYLLMYAEQKDIDPVLVKSYIQKYYSKGLAKMMLESIERVENAGEKKQAPKVGKFEEQASGSTPSLGEGSPSSGVIGFGNNAQLLLMTDQLDVLKEIRTILDNSRSPAFAPDFTKSMVNIKVPPTPTIPTPAK
jgi:hypothetical protein